MNLLTKVFVVLVLVLSMAFLGVTSALFVGRKKLREEVADLNKKLVKLKSDFDEYRDDREKKISVLKDEQAKLAVDHEKVRENLKDVEAQLSEKVKELGERKSEISTLSLQVTKLGEGLDQAVRNESSMKTERDTLRAELAKTKEELDKVSKQAAELAARNDDLGKQLVSVKKDLNEKNEAVKAYERLIENLRERGIQVDAVLVVKPPPAMDGKVLVVNSELGFVIVDLGKNKGLSPGHELIVYRDEGYVGRLVVEEVYNDLAKARIRKPLQKLPIQEGDDVTTRILTALQ